MDKHLQSGMLRRQRGVSLAGLPVGGKARALALLPQDRFVTPDWAVILPESAVSETSLQELVRELGGLVAVRSSAQDEDGAEHSFAGQLESYLNVTEAEIAEKVEAVRRSGTSERILAYRRERGFAEPPPMPAVLIQTMLRPESAGVAFSVDPVSGRWGVAVVSAVRGLGEKLVSGEANADTYRIGVNGAILERLIVSDHPVLTDAQAKEVATLARACADHFGRPQDIEWAIQNGRCFLLQSRPITSLGRIPDPDGRPAIWDNSNIAESYSGVTTPLTFSYALKIYEEVYRQFCRLMGVSEVKIADHREVFGQMLGLIRGRIYYHLLNWYRVLALLPGYKMNRAFMEQMMGVKETLPPGMVELPENIGWGDRLRDGFDLVRALLGLVGNHWMLPHSIRQFYKRLNGALAEPPIPFSQMRPDQLRDAYRHLEKQLLTRWDAPLVNDFFAMIFYGVLRKQVQKRFGTGEENLQNDLLCAEGGMISAEPAKRVRRMAEMAGRQPALVERLCIASADSILDGPEWCGEIKTEFEAYISKFGDRCLEELKLESLTLHDDPTPLLRSIGHFAKRLATGGGERMGPSEEEKRLAAEAKVHGVLFKWILKNARARVRDRENLRFERTRLFGRVRRIFVELGKRFHAIGRLNDPRDIFYLTVEEALGFVDGATVTTDLRALVEIRKKEYDGYRNSGPPADRFETRGMVYHAQAYAPTRTAPAPAVDGSSLRGIACCPGIVEGVVRVVRDPKGAEIRHGEILVAERTDPGWIMLFPAAAGLLVEHGSLLSHSAIVSRELGIPSIVALTGVTQWLVTGDRVMMDGSAGVVRRLKPGEIDAK